MVIECGKNSSIIVWLVPEYQSTPF